MNVRKQMSIVRKPIVRSVFVLTFSYVVCYNKNVYAVYTYFAVWFGGVIVDSENFIKLEGVVDTVLFSNPVNGYVVLDLDVNGDYVTVVGELGNIGTDCFRSLYKARKIWYAVQSKLLREKDARHNKCDTEISFIGSFKGNRQNTCWTYC